MDTELKALLRLLLHKSWLIALMAVVFVGAVILYRDHLVEPEYEAVAKLIVHAAANSDSVETYKEIVLTPAILAPAAARYSELGLTAEELGARVTVGATDKSQVIQIAARASSPDEADVIVRAVATTFQEEIPYIMKVDSVTLLSGNRNNNPPRDVSASLSSLIAIALALSVIASVGLILLREYFDDKVRTEQEIALLFGKPALGSLARIRGSDLRTAARTLPAAKKGQGADAAAGASGAETTKKMKAGETINVGVNQQA